ncbi:MAG: class I SAM-dependent methyltransferase [Planctomycetota bacterium]|jgi:16S rRNA (guanine(1405)-N(7))-methyltransferase
MSDEVHTEIESVLREVLRSRKYSRVCPSFVRSLAGREIGKGRSAKEALKAVKTRLHQVGGSCVEDRPDYDGWLSRLKTAASEGTRLIETTCLELLDRHLSTRERSGFLADYYGAILDGLPAPSRILDLACGLHPLSTPWMGVEGDVEYIALDIYSDLVDFLNGAFPLLGIRGRAMAADVLTVEHRDPADLAFVQKALPALERVEKGSGIRLLSELDVPTLIVSYPARTLGGRRKGLAGGYEKAFDEMIATTGWSVDRFVFPTEIVFRISK